MSKFYSTGDGNEYEEVGGVRHGKGNPREALLEVVDRLLEKEEVVEMMEDEMAMIGLPFDEEPNFREGFRTGMAFMLFLHSEGKVKSILIHGNSRAPVHTFRRMLAKIFGITPLDFIDR